MFTAHPSPLQRLRGFIDAILMEERRFQLWDHILDTDYKQLLFTHNRIADHCDCARNHKELRKTHECIFTKHKEITVEHVEYTNYCMKLNEKIKLEQFDSEQVTCEVEKLSEIYEKMRTQHQQMEIERKIVLKEHNDFTANSIENGIDLSGIK